MFLTHQLAKSPLIYISLYATRSHPRDHTIVRPDTILAMNLAVDQNPLFLLTGAIALGDVSTNMILDFFVVRPRDYCQPYSVGAVEDESVERTNSDVISHIDGTRGSDTHAPSPNRRTSIGWSMIRES